MKAGKVIKDGRDHGIRPLLWRCFCGQFNNVAENKCMACGQGR